MSSPRAFGLQALLPQEGNPFDRHPELAALWSPVLAGIASEAIDEAFDLHAASGPNQADYGAIFLITHPDNASDIWGITGFLPWPDAADGLIQRVGLRWHGLLPEHRGQGLSLAVIDRMRELAHQAYPQARHLVEFMPVSAEHAATATYFEKAGFVKWGEPERVYWTSDKWQEYVCDIRTPLRQSNAPSAQEPAP